MSDEHPTLPTEDAEITVVGDLVGEVIAERYRVLDLIGRGGMGCVYRAEHILMKKVVALKVLHPEMTIQSDIVKRFEREAVAAGRIEHPNVARATDFGRLEDGSFYLALEYVEGQSLHAALEAGAMPEDRALNIAGQIAEGLAAAHKEGIVHRDLKPENIMLVERDDGSVLVKVLDFGIAKVPASAGSSGAPLTLMGTVFGTPAYMSPEQAAGQTVDHRADIYSLGILMFDMLTGDTPFNSEDLSAVLMKQITEVPPELTDVSEGTAQLVADLLKKQPDERPQEATDIVGRIVGMLGDVAVDPSKTRVQMASRPGSIADIDIADIDMELISDVANEHVSMPRWWFAVGMLVVAAVGAGGFYVYSERAAGDEVAAADEKQSAYVDDGPIDAVLEMAAISGEPEAIETLQKIPPAKRGVRHSLALASGLLKMRRPKPALAAYREALERDPELAEDLSIVRQVRLAATQPGVQEVALKLAADHLKSRGADILYEVWVGTKARTPITQLANELVGRADVRGKASASLSIALDLREAKSCDDYHALLPRAVRHGDRRTAHLLSRLTKEVEECELETEVESAIAAARERPSPVY